MVRIDSLRRSLFALVPFVALTSVACGGGGGADPTESSSTESANAANSGSGTSTEEAQNPSAEEVEKDDPSNGTVEGREGEDEGYAAAIAQNGEALADDTSADDPGSDVAQTSDALLSTRGTSLINEAKRQLNFLNRSTSYYSHTTYMNESTGTRRTDCSGFVGYALNRVQPTAYAKVPHPNTFKPLANDWYNYLSTRYTSASTQSTPRWRKITSARNLKPGDLVVWLTAPGQVTSNTGHIMVVNGYPRAGRTGEVIIPIIDSTTAPHASDSRGSSMTGIGSGSIGLKVDSTGKPSAYYWRGGLSYNAISTKIALGRLE